MSIQIMNTVGFLRYSVAYVGLHKNNISTMVAESELESEW